VAKRVEAVAQQRGPLSKDPWAHYTLEHIEQHRGKLPKSVRVRRVVMHSARTTYLMTKWRSLVCTRWPCPLRSPGPGS